jgi:FtsZ-interacting cell division protein ZipA
LTRCRGSLHKGNGQQGFLGTEQEPNRTLPVTHPSDQYSRSIHTLHVRDKDRTGRTEPSKRNRTKQNKQKNRTGNKTTRTEPNRTEPEPSETEPNGTERNGTGINQNKTQTKPNQREENTDRAERKRNTQTEQGRTEPNRGTRPRTVWKVNYMHVHVQTVRYQAFWISSLVDAAQCPSYAWSAHFVSR